VNELRVSDVNVATKELSQHSDMAARADRTAALAKIWQFFRLLD